MRMSMTHTQQKKQQQQNVPHILDIPLRYTIHHHHHASKYIYIDNIKLFIYCYFIIYLVNKGFSA